MTENYEYKGDIFYINGKRANGKVYKYSCDIYKLYLTKNRKINNDKLMFVLNFRNGRYHGKQIDYRKNNRYSSDKLYKNNYKLIEYYKDGEQEGKALQYKYIKWNFNRNKNKKFEYYARYYINDELIVEKDYNFIKWLEKCPRLWRRKKTLEILDKYLYQDLNFVIGKYLR
jgi:hypothetical protein